MVDDARLEEDLRRWFRALDLEHPAVRILWKIALEQKRRAQEASGRAS